MILTKNLTHMKKIAAFFLLIAVHPFILGQQGGQQKPDIFNIVDQFIVSAAAVKKCAPPDKETEEAFLANLMTVTIAMLKVVKERNPGVSDARLKEQAGRRIDLIKAATEQEIERSGCESERVQKSIQFYKMQATCKIGAR